MKFLLALSTKVKIIIAVSLAVAAAGVTGLVIFLNAEETYRVLKVFEITGTAVVSRANTGELDAYAGMNLESGDVISVNEGSTLRISLDGDKYVLLDSGTVIELIAEGTAADSRTSINLKQGTILNEITSALSANSSYEVNTPKATMAVRGTSFTVTVTKLADGGYITDVNTIHGKVSVQLYNEDGTPKGEEVIVKEGYCVSIVTDLNESTGNTPDIDGIAYFVINDNGEITVCGDSDDPVVQTYYLMLSDAVKFAALNSNDSGVLVLDAEIVLKLKGNTPFTAETTAAETVSETTAVTSDTTVTTAVETEITEQTTETVQTTVKETEQPAVTTVPETSVTKAESTVIPSEISTVETESETTTETTAKETTVKETTAKETTITTTTAVTTVPGTSATVSTKKTSASTTAKTEQRVTTITVSQTETEAVTTTTTAPETEAEVTTTTTEAQSASYTVSFAAEGADSVPSDITVDDGTALADILPEVPSRTGYDGVWTVNGSDCSGVTVTENITVTAQYTPKTITVDIIIPSTPDDQCRPAFAVKIDYGSTFDSNYGSAFTNYDGYFNSGYESFFTSNGGNWTVASLTSCCQNYLDSFKDSGYYESNYKYYVLGDIMLNGSIPLTDGTVFDSNAVTFNADGSLTAVIYCNNAQVSTD